MTRTSPEAEPSLFPPCRNRWRLAYYVSIDIKPIAGVICHVAVSVLPVDICARGWCREGCRQWDPGGHHAAVRFGGIEGRHDSNVGLSFTQMEYWEKMRAKVDSVKVYWETRSPGYKNQQAAPSRRRRLESTRIGTSIHGVADHFIRRKIITASMNMILGKERLLQF